MPSSLRDGLFGNRAGGPRRPDDGSEGTGQSVNAPLPKKREKPAQSRRERRDRQRQLEEAERRRAAGETDVDYNPNRWRGLVPLAIALVLVLVGAGYAWNTLGLSLPSLSSSGGDYSGDGNSDTTLVTIGQGDSGGVVGSKLVAAGVTKSTSAFVSAMDADQKAILQPGTYRLHKKQSAASALAALLNPSSRVGGVTIPEGLWANEIFQRLSKATGQPISAYKAVKASDLGLPGWTNGVLDGWLFPSTYNFAPKTSAKAQLQQMVKLTRQELQQAGVSDGDARKVLTEASIIQAESPDAEADGKVGRVIENRVKQGMPLQMDSSIHYILQKRGTVTTTDQQRKSSSPYNTYVHSGLPPTPYNSPGLVAIKAAANPTPGPWLYFVAVNLATGETKFATTYSEQLKNEQQFHQWCHDNPGKGC